jgi:cytochrome c553
MQQKCSVCHSVTSKSHEEIIAPPMIAVKKRYLMQYDNKEEFVAAIVGFSSDPKAENALMLPAVKQFNAMPKQAFDTADLKKIAAYIYDNKIETPVWFEAHFQQNHKNGQGMGMGMQKNQ